MAIVPTPLIYHNAGLGGNGGLNDLTAGGRNLTAFNGAEIIADTDSGGTQAFNMLPTVPQQDSHFRDSAFTSLDGVAQCTISAWIKHDGSSGKQMIVCNHGRAMGNVQLYRNGQSIVFYNGYYEQDFASADAEEFLSTLAVINSDQWYHVVATFDGGAALPDDRMKIYIDGVDNGGTRTQYGTGLTQIQNSTIVANANYAIGALQEVSVGGTPTGNILYDFQGRVDSVRMWDTVLTQAQITSLSTSRNYTNNYPTGLGTEECWYCPSIDDSAVDLTGNGNDGTYQGGMATVVDSDPTYGGTRAYSFDGIDDFIETLSPTMDTFSNSYSMSLWVKPSSVSVRQPYATLVSDNGDYRAAYAANEADGSHVCGHNLTGALEFVTSPPGTATVGWLHLCYTYDAVATFMELFINGTSVGGATKSACNWTNASRFDVGRRKYSTTEDYMTGRIDDLRFYQTVLTQEEIDVISTSRGIEGSGGGNSKNILLLGVG